MSDHGRRSSEGRHAIGAADDLESRELLRAVGFEYGGPGRIRTYNQGIMSPLH
jgi:hypothetical protein